MENLTVNITDCEKSFDSTNNKVIAALRASVGFISFVCCILVILLIVLFKKYKFFTQRLILYLAVAAMIHSFSYCIARVNYYTPRSIEDPYCYFAGLLNYYTSVVELLSVWCIVISLCVQAWFNRSTAKLKPLYLCVMFLLPVLWSWIPLWRKTFGTSNIICGFKFINSDCSTNNEAKWLLFGLWYIPLYVSMFLILILMLLVSIKAVRDLRKWSGSFYDRDSKMKKDTMSRELRPLILYPFIFLLLNTFSFISQIYRAANPDNPSIVLSYLHVLTSPLRGAVIALAYALDRDTRSRLNYMQCRASCKEWCGNKEDKVESYEAVYSGTTDSLLYVPFKDTASVDHKK